MSAFNEELVVELLDVTAGAGAAGGGVVTGVPIGGGSGSRATASFSKTGPYSPRLHFA